MFVEREVANAQRIKPAFMLLIEPFVVPQGDERVFRAGGRLLVLVREENIRSCYVLREVLFEAVEGEEPMASVRRGRFLTIDRQV